MRQHFEDRVEARFVDLETKVAYQEKTIFDLNDVVIGQQRTMNELRRRVATLEEQLRQALDDAGPPIERPPHY